MWRILLLALVLVPLVHDASAHPLFNSYEETIGDRRIQIATLPEFPEPGRDSLILVRVTDTDLNEVDGFVMGIRIFYGGVQIDGIAPQQVPGGHWEIDYVFKEAGNHIFRVDLYDNGDVRTFTFNVGTQNPFGFIFIYVIAAGAIGMAGILVYVYVPRILKKKS